MSGSWVGAQCGCSPVPSASAERIQRAAAERAAPAEHAQSALLCAGPHGCLPQGHPPAARQPAQRYTNQPHLPAPNRFQIRLWEVLILLTKTMAKNISWNISCLRWKNTEEHWWSTNISKHDESVTEPVCVPSHSWLSCLLQKSATKPSQWQTEIIINPNTDLDYFVCTCGCQINAGVQLLCHICCFNRKTWM